MNEGINMVTINAAEMLAGLEYLADTQERLERQLPGVQCHQGFKVNEDFPTDFKHAAESVYTHFLSHASDEGWNQFDPDKVEKGYRIIQAEGFVIMYVKSKGGK